MVFFKSKTHSVSILQEQLSEMGELRSEISAKADETVGGENDISDEESGDDVSDSEEDGDSSSDERPGYFGAADTVGWGMPCL